MGVDSLAGAWPDGLSCKEIRLTINKPDKIRRRIDVPPDIVLIVFLVLVLGKCIGYNPLALRASPFVKGECALGSQRIATEATLRPTFGVQPSAPGATVVHFPGEPLCDERTTAKNDSQQQHIDERLRQEHSK
jgi:hypothetical protein